MTNFDYPRTIPAVAELLDQANRKDVRTVESNKPMRAFVAALLSYMPGWMRFLYRVRGVFVRFLGERQHFQHSRPAIAPEDLSFTPGQSAAFFTVTAAEEDRYWIAGASDKVITGYIAVVVEPLQDGVNRFHVLTMAKYTSWASPIYFNVINLFHHIVVKAMIQNALR